MTQLPPRHCSTPGAFWQFMECIGVSGMQAKAVTQVRPTTLAHHSTALWRLRLFSLARTHDFRLAGHHADVKAHQEVVCPRRARNHGPSAHFPLHCSPPAGLTPRARLRVRATRPSRAAAARPSVATPRPPRPEYTRRACRPVRRSPTPRSDRRVPRTTPGRPRTRSRAFPELMPLLTERPGRTTLLLDQAPWEQME